MPGNKKHHSAKMRSCVAQVMADGHDESSAYAICTASLQKAGEPIFETAEACDEGLRIFDLRGATTAPRIETWNGREHIVVPVVALMEGVIQAVNAGEPEFVPLQTLAEAAASWNGRPVVLGHPTKNGRQCSANAPDVMTSHGLGTIFNSRVEGKKLLQEAWIDKERAMRLNPEMTKRLLAGETIDVSVGAFVGTASGDGSYNGKQYKATWLKTNGDHLAFLPGKKGACSSEMGCGTFRAAMHVIEGDQIVVEEGANMTLRERVVAFVEEVRAAETTDEVVERFLGKHEDCPTCKGSGNADGNPCEVCEGSGEMRAAAGKRNSAADLAVIQEMHDRSIALGAECTSQNVRFMESDECTTCSGAGKINDVECKTCRGTGKIKKVDSAGDGDGGAKTTEEARAAEEADRILAEKAAAGEAAFRAACGCKGDSKMNKEQKDELVKTLVNDKYSGFTAGDEKMLEAASDERLESFRVAAESRKTQEEQLRAAAEKKLSPEEFMEVAPPELKSLIKRQQKQETETKASLVTQLKAAQSEYSEAELSVMPVDELMRMARVAKVNVKIDYSGRGVPRALATADDEEEDFTPPNAYEAGIKALQAKA